MATALAPETESSLRFLRELFQFAPLRQVAFRLPDGTPWPDARPRAATFVLNHPGALREMFAAGTEMAIAEAFLRGEFDIEGDIESAFELADAMGEHRDAGWLTLLRRYYRLQQLPAKSAANRGFVGGRGAKHSLPRDRQAVSFHYDVSNDFYRLWLDQRMVYSCAYFKSPDVSLDEAQEAKLEHLCRKLRLRPGQRLLDIGCGWGGLAIHAAQHHDVRVTGVTLSRQQVDFASDRVRAAGLEGQVRISLQDYREVTPDEPFDAIVSVGMSEHVGTAELVNYFRTASALLKPGGVFLNHAIGEGPRPRPRSGPSFIEHYVFPDSDIPPVPVVVQAAETAGLEVRDVENLREHYALTLRHWVRGLEAAHEQALRFVNEPTYRVWRLYMAGSAHGFARGQMAVYQVLLSKPDAGGRAQLPLTRRDWYS